jgi:transcriptional regulator with GAF, ATPase, and Fis domain
MERPFDLQRVIFEGMILLVPYFVWPFAEQMNKTIEAIPSATMEALSRCPWSI